MALFKKKIRVAEIVDQLAERTAIGIVSRARSRELLSPDPVAVGISPDLRQQRELVMQEVFAYMRGANLGLPKGVVPESMLRELFKALGAIFVREGLFATQDEFQQLYRRRHADYCDALDDEGKHNVSGTDKVQRLSFKALELVGGSTRYNLSAAMGLANNMMVTTIETKKMFEGIRGEFKIVE